MELTKWINKNMCPCEMDKSAVQSIYSMEEAQGLHVIGECKDCSEEEGCTIKDAIFNHPVYLAPIEFGCIDFKKKEV